MNETETKQTKNSLRMNERVGSLKDKQNWQILSKTNQKRPPKVIKLEMKKNYKTYQISIIQKNLNIPFKLIFHKLGKENEIDAFLNA